MKDLTKPLSVLVVLGALVLAAPGCGGGSNSSSSGGGGSGANGGGGTGGSTGGTTMSTGGTGGTAGSGGTGGTGGAADSGAQGSAFVNAGGVGKSASYKMVFTLGQSTPTQSRLSSPSYRLQGGVIGATGSFK